MKVFSTGLFKAVLLLVVIAAPSAFAQFSASVQGMVQDSSAASIPKAKVTLVNVDTKVTQQTAADGAGVYRFASLAPGNYEVSGIADGFSGSKVAFKLSADQNRDVPLTLAVGEVSTNVMVSSQAPLLDTADSRNEQTLDTQALQTLPLVANNPTNVITLTPGVVGLGTFGATNFGTEVIDASANGRGANGNQFVLDGLDVTSDINPGVLVLVPNADALSEISVQPNTYTVDYGRASSIQTVMTTKSGSEQFHGFGSEFYSYQGLDAKGEFFRLPSINPFHTNNMSFGLTGPILPKKKLFFSFTIEPYRALNSNGNSVQIYEDPAFLAFAQQARPNSPEVQLMTKYQPTGATTTGIASTAQDAFGPQNLAQNTGCATPSTDNIPCNTPVFDQGNFNSTSYMNAKQWTLRIDKYFNKDRLYGNIFRSTINQGGPSVRPA
jgi:hypothetical protein